MLNPVWRASFWLILGVALILFLSLGTALTAIRLAVAFVILRGWRQGGLALLQLPGLC